ncbi:uncharacterized protein L969DRAFT_95133 [Mixia osmundae IAM 14324]|uniref:Wbp11/ELF5/Saf1 N-terminal domain-containing protein n=1 Tax=Mixia osmundae (strain CBS 9802 / IAM 14324 / JCM 22182 / KY 12970) TaxID=764103 RepID=G7E731_MIXOS|nr:uncharacterized protein L969DRAFT_95133 [Mixia osmundae IAM 14324]KEI38976.1 hypothetical protein L969DRAFT_95133 [Mixia osmundae IAM 14324]GAA98641.1 hypothetical protein E5Q_05328 [Mixia osmundae IAM 14324]
MAGAKNPMEAKRKQDKKKQLAKNKAARTESKQNKLLKADHRTIDAEIRTLSATSSLSAEDTERLASLKKESERIHKAKEAYLEQHPEARSKLFPAASTSAPRPGPSLPVIDTKDLYDSTGKLKDPTRSAYYDPVFNPFGAPPPGMQYKEREDAPPLPQIDASSEDGSDESQQDEQSEADSDDEIPLPSGPPPLPQGVPDQPVESESSDEEFEIPMPAGPPPPKHIVQRPIQTTAPPRPTFVPPRPLAPLPAKPTLAAKAAQDPTRAPITQEEIKRAAASATISAAPQIRDLKKEATSFVPSALQRKRKADE